SGLRLRSCAIHLDLRFEQLDEAKLGNEQPAERRHPPGLQGDDFLALLRLLRQRRAGKGQSEGGSQGDRGPHGSHRSTPFLFAKSASASRRLADSLIFRMLSRYSIACSASASASSAFCWNFSRDSFASASASSTIRVRA